MTTKHTPGPWQTYMGTGIVACVHHHGMHGAMQTLVAECNTGTAYPVPREVREQAAANAALIAAAPDMLDALRDLLRGAEHELSCAAGPECSCRVSRARAAIAKAEGK